MEISGVVGDNDGYLLFVMRKIARHGDDMILNITQVKTNFASRSNFPLLITLLCETFDDIGLGTEESVEAHDLFPTFSNVAKHVGLLLKRVFFVFTGGVHVENHLINVVYLVLDTLNKRCISIGDVVDESVRYPVCRQI